MKLEQVALNSLVRQIQHAFNSLSRPSRLPLSVAGLLGISGLLLVLKESNLGCNFNWPCLPNTTQNSQPNLLFVPGLQNLGNNCFLNVILQALASCSCFQPFLRKVLEECEVLDADCVPLTISLAALFEELCTVGGGRIVSSPRRVMFAMSHYIQNFDLTSEQDATEAFLHLLSSLRDEFSDFYCSNEGSVAEVLASSSRIIIPKRMEGQSEQERWKQCFFGPFDGILGSTLTCQSCSLQLASFTSSYWGDRIMAGCALEDCLKKFTAAEQVENYRCTHCWHIAAVKHISIGGNEATVQKIESCTKEDSCDCERLVHLETIPWSNRFSRTSKQISMARCAKIFCIHLKRVSVNVFGELKKLQGHISFPLILDLSSYMISGVETNCWEKNWKTGRVQLQSGNPSPNPNPFNLEYDPRRLNFVQGLARGCTYQEGLASDASQFTANALDSSPEFPSEGSFSETTQQARSR